LLAVFLIVGGITASLLIALTIAYIYRQTMSGRHCNDRSKQMMMMMMAEKNTVGGGLVVYDESMTATTRRSCSPVTTVGSTGRTMHSRRTNGRTCVTALYFAFWGIYSIAFTFTALSLVAVTLTGSAIVRLRGGGGVGVTVSTTVTIRSAVRNVTAAASLSVDRYAAAETRRLEEAVTEAQRACSDSYVNELFVGVAALMHDVMTADRETVSQTLRHRTSELMDVYKRRLDSYAADYRANLTSAVSAAVSAYRKYLKRVMGGDWLAFPRRLFNETGPAFAATGSSVGRLRGVRLAASDDLLGEDADVGAFMEIEEVENVQLWPIQFWERFDYSLPMMPSLPVLTLNHSAPHCQLDGTRHVPNVTRNIPLDRLDSSHFVSSSPPATSPSPPSTFDSDSNVPDGSSSNSGGDGGSIGSYPPRYSTGNVAEEYRLLPEEQAAGGTGTGRLPGRRSGSDDSEAFHSSSEYRGGRTGGVFDQFNLDALRILFLILDALLLLYRITNVYVGGVLVSRRFGAVDDYEDSSGAAAAADRTPLPSPSKLLTTTAGANQINMDQQRTCCPPSRPIAMGCGAREHSVVEVPPVTSGYARDCIVSGDYLQQPVRLQQQQYNPEYHIASSADGNAVRRSSTVELKDETLPERHNCDTAKVVIGQMLESSSLPKAIVAVILTLMFYVVARSVVVLLDVGLLSSVDALGVYVQSVGVRVNQTNQYIDDTARHLNDLARAVYGEQMKAELINLQSLVEFFNAEQWRLTKNYAAEICAIKKRSHDDNWTCDVLVSPSRLEVPMLPCNFIPVQPHLYTDFDTDDFESQLNVALEPVVDAIRTVITRTSYIALAVVSCTLAVHVASCFLFHHFRLSSSPAVDRRRRVYVTTAHAPSADDMPPPQQPLHDHQVSSGRHHNATGRPEPEVGDTSDSADDAGVMSTRLRPPLPPGPPKSPPVIFGPPSSLLHGTTQLKARTNNSATLLSQSSLDFKYSETKV
jgi:hypothetical protein